MIIMMIIIAIRSTLKGNKIICPFRSTVNFYNHPRLIINKIYQITIKATIISIMTTITITIITVFSIQIIIQAQVTIRIRIPQISNILSITMAIIKLQILKAETFRQNPLIFTPYSGENQIDK